jgi:hypothetical protein
VDFRVPFAVWRRITLDTKTRSQTTCTLIYTTKVILDISILNHWPNIETILTAGTVELEKGVASL